jgi:hypothetical protein
VDTLSWAETVELLTNVVAIVVPFHRMTESVLYPDPLTCNVTVLETTAELGETAAMLGAKLLLLLLVVLIPLEA